MTQDGTPNGFGDLLRSLRLASRLTQEELAETAGLSARALADMERGRTARPRPGSVLRIAVALGLTEAATARLRLAARGLDGQDAAATKALADVASPESRPQLPGAVVPRQLPAPVRHFAGRSDELALLAGLADRVGRDTGPAVVISAIGGLAGVGKTALAIRWAHQAAGSFPDGQLYVNLRGYDPALPPMPASEAVRMFLDAFEVPAARIPASSEAQAGMYRSLLAGKKVLIVADNAADANQVRPLLPGSPGCLVIVTSRSTLGGLVAIDGAIPLSLDVLTSAEARDLLAGVLGEARVDAEPEAVDQLVELCGRLPLALAVTAARAATRPGLRLAALAAELADSAGRLDALEAAGDPLASVRAALDCSYRQLNADAARTLRLLGVHPGPDISLPAAGSLIGLPGPQAARHLAELAGASLITQDDAGRYSLHDLVRLYAGEQAQRAGSDTERDAATERMLHHYMHTGRAAALLQNPARDPIVLDSPSAGTVPEHLADDQAALSWFAAEHPVLIAAAGHAIAAGQDAHAWAIAWTLQNYLSFQGHWQDLLAVQTAALAAAVRLDDVALQARSHQYLANITIWLGRYDDANSHFWQSIELFRRAGNDAGQAHAHLGLAGLLSRRGQHAEAADQARQAFELFAAAGHERGQADALNHVGWLLSQLGDHEQALVYCERALAHSRKIGDRHGEAAALDSLGHTHHHLGQYAEAVTGYQQALDIARELGLRPHQAEALTHLADAHQASGDLEAARAAWQEAVAILDDLQHPDAASIRSKLEAAETGHAPAAQGSYASHLAR